MEKFTKIRAISFDYGQRHNIELPVATEICEKYSITHEVLAVNSLKELGGNALTSDSIEVASGETENTMPNTFVPGRNIIFLTLAAARAYQLNITDIVTGLGQEDYSGYPDCREEFIDSMEKTLRLGTDKTFIIHRPLMFMNKAEIWELSNQLGHLQEIIELTHTCYNGTRDQLHDWGYGCDSCPACKLRADGYRLYMEKKNGI
jgi:7-cyano-7-deazaguanine synthase